MHTLNKTFVCLLLSTAVIRSGICEDTKVTNATRVDCLNTIGNDPSFIETLNKTFGNDEIRTTDMKQTDIKEALYKSIVEHVASSCSFKEINTIADTDQVAFDFKFHDKKFRIIMDTDAFFNHTHSSTALMFGMNHNYEPGQVLNANELKITDKYDWLDDCSWRYNIVAPAATQTCNEHAICKIGRSHVYDGSYSDDSVNNADALSIMINPLTDLFQFPGIIIHTNIQTNGVYSTITGVVNYNYLASHIVAYSNYKKGRMALKNLTNALDGTSCTSKAFYHVMHDDVGITYSATPQKPSTSLNVSGNNSNKKVTILSDAIVVK